MNCHSLEQYSAKSKQSLLLPMWGQGAYRGSKTQWEASQAVSWKMNKWVSSTAAKPVIFQDGGYDIECQCPDPVTESSLRLFCESLASHKFFSLQWLGPWLGFSFTRSPTVSRGARPKTVSAEAQSLCVQWLGFGQLTEWQDLKVWRWRDFQIQYWHIYFN